MKKSISVLLCTAIIISLLAGVSVFASDGISVYLDGERLIFDTAPQIINGRTMVPMRVIFEAFGKHVHWNEQLQQITVPGMGRWTYTLSIGEYQIIHSHPTWGMEDENHEAVMDAVLERIIELDVAPQIIDGRTLVPLRAISEVFGSDVQWDPDFRTVTIVSTILVEILQEMGINRAFFPALFDFHDMVYPTYVEGRELFIWIDDIIQKTFIEVDEEGTEAAAATAVIMDAVPLSVPPPPIPFYCDRPFIYFIRNDTTGDILFMGEFAFAE